MSSRPSTAAPPRVASAQRLARRQRGGPWATRCSSSACARLARAGRAPSFDALPSTPRPTRTPASSIARTGAMPERQPHVRRTGSARRRCRVRGEAGRCPARRASRSARARRPRRSSRAPRRTRPACSRSARASRRRRCRSRRDACAGRRRSARASAAVSRIRSRDTENGEQGAAADAAASRAARGSWNASMTRARVGEDRVLVARPASRAAGRRSLSPTLIAPRQAWKRMPISRGRVDRVVEPAAVRIQVQVVAGRRAAGEHQLGHAGLRRDVQHLRRQPRPDRIERRAASRTARRPARPAPRASASGTGGDAC